jgi:dTDP-4-amino-4,6-dideoxygalactose transaminase
MILPDILLNDFRRQWSDTSEAVLAAVARVGQSGWYILGREVATFEHALAEILGRQHAIGCGSGLDAIEIALRAVGLKPRMKVLTTPLSAFATTLAIVRAGGVPVFVDVDEHGLIDLEKCREAFERDRAIRAMVPVHLFGHALHLSTLAELRTIFDLLVVEDCAQSIGAFSCGRRAGAVGQLAATSFYPTKNLGALGDGGAIATDSEALASRCRSLRDYGQTKKYVHEEIGLNSRLDEVHAAVLLRAFLPKLSSWTERRRVLAETYSSQIRHPSIRVVPGPPGSESVWHLFPVQVPATAREAFMSYLRSKGIQTAIHYPRLIPHQSALTAYPFEVRGELTRAAELAATEVSLPIHPYLEDHEVARIIDAVNAWPGV